MAKSLYSLHLHPLKVSLSIIVLVEVFVVLHPRLVHVPVPRPRGHHRRLEVGPILLYFASYHCHQDWQFEDCNILDAVDEYHATSDS